jgi:hypothetical protein
MRRILLAVAGLFLPLLCGSYTAYESAKQKFELIESESLRAGSRVSLTPRELNAYVEREAPDGVRNPTLDLGSGSATGSALVDFLKLRRAQGQQPGWLMSKLLEGERPVRVVARVTSGNGRAQVDVQSVEISGISIEGRMLDYLIRNYLHSYYPGAKVGEPFELGHRIDRLEIKPSSVGVVIGR